MEYTIDAATNGIAMDGMINDNSKKDAMEQN